MKSASIAEVKNGFSKYVRAVQKGEEIIVTNRGESVAKLVPFDPGERLGLELIEHERRMVREGRLLLPKKKWDPVAFNKLPIGKGTGSAVQALLEDREDRF